MNFHQATAAIEELMRLIPEIFSDIKIEFAFGEGRPPIGDWSDFSNLGVLVNGDKIGSKCGIYFFGTTDGQIIYIGKATKNNLHNRVWDHIRTPTELPGGKREFPKHIFGDCINEPELARQIRDGNILLGIVTVSDTVVVSFIEVYLHTLYIKQYGHLPILNKQIG